MISLLSDSRSRNIKKLIKKIIPTGKLVCRIISSGILACSLAITNRLLRATALGTSHLPCPNNPHICSRTLKGMNRLKKESINSIPTIATAQANNENIRELRGKCSRVLHLILYFTIMQRNRNKTNLPESIHLIKTKIICSLNLTMVLQIRICLISWNPQDLSKC